MKNHKSLIWAGILVILLSLAACGGTPEPEDATATTVKEAMAEATASPVPATEKPTEEPTEESAEELPSEADVMTLLASDQLDLASLYANVDEETTGPILTMQLVNQSDGELIVEIPCGLIFVPDDGDEQPLIVVEPQTIAIPLGGEAEITPYVVCADIGTEAPSLSATYTVGTLTEDAKMQQLVDCVCDKGFDTSLDNFEGVNVQFAVWFVQMGGDPAGYVETMAEEITGGSFEEFSGEEGDIDFFLEMFEMYVGDWLAECGINFDE